MIQWVKAPATKPDDLRLIPRTHKVEGRTSSCKLSSDLHKYTQIQKNVIKIVKPKSCSRAVLTE